MPSRQRPVFALDVDDEQSTSRTAYIRVADENIVASPIHLAIWRQEQRLQGEAFADTDEERTLLKTLNEYPQGLTLNQLLKAAKPTAVARPLAITLLARFIRFGLARIMPRERQWILFPND